jgi:ribonuclease BN (tRNA processing enzyme)
MSNEVHKIEDSHYQFDINSKGWYLKGYSRAGSKTGFLFYPFKILFDCGIHTSSKPDIIFLTHQHTDHMQAIANICSRHKPTVSTIYLPEPSVRFITKYERIISELSDPEAENYTDEEILLHQNICLVPKNPGDIFNITTGSGQQLQIEVLKAYHSVQSNGYGISSWKKIIKPEYERLIKEISEEEKISLSSEEQKQLKINKIKEIKDLKSKNIDMYNAVLNPEFAFYCDSTIQNLSEEVEWKKYPVIICECTGLDITKLDSTRDYDENHTSLLKLKPIMLENKDKRWLLIHVGMGCSNDKIEEIKTELKNEGIDVEICF